MTGGGSIEEWWAGRRALTTARVGLGRAGVSLPTHRVLEFQAAHALARDAVSAPFDSAQMARSLADVGPEVLEAWTQAGSRESYLRHPGLGRLFDDESARRLAEWWEERSGLWSPNRSPAETADVVIAVSDGLSATAAEQHAATVVRATVGQLDDAGLGVAAILVVPLARVGLLNDIGSVLHPRAAAIVLGERPGLSAPDSLGAYVEVAPGAGMTDADRNCLSNIRPRGLDPPDAGRQLAHIIATGLSAGHSGFLLKVESPVQFD